jgi:hypothetical protein
MKFIAFKEGKVIKHPKTGEVLDVETIEVGEIEITDARDKTANGIILREAGPQAVSYGTMVRSAIKGQLVNLEEEAPKPAKQKDAPPKEYEQQPAPSYDRGGKMPKVDIPAPTF